MFPQKFFTSRRLSFPLILLVASLVGFFRSKNFRASKQQFSFKKKISFIIIFLFPLVLFGCDNKKSDVNGDYLFYFEKSRKFLENKEYGNAIPYLDRAIELNPKFKEGYFWRSAAYVEERRYDEALDDLEKLLKLEDYHYKTYCRFAAVYLLKQNYNKVIKYTDLALKEPAPDHLNAMLSKAGALFILERFNESLESFDKFYEEAKNTNSQMLRGRASIAAFYGPYSQVAEAVKDIDKAKNIMLDAAKNNPQEFLPYAKLSYLELKYSKDEKQAYEYFKKAAKLEKDFNQDVKSAFEEFKKVRTDPIENYTIFLFNQKMKSHE